MIILKDYNSFLNDLAHKESSGTWNVVNSIGYLGYYQMGEAALQDAGYYLGDGTLKNDWTGTWTGKNNVNSKDDFLSNTYAQTTAINAYMKKQWEYIKHDKSNNYIGTTINGVKITASSLLAAAHLVGHVGLKKYLQSNGNNDVKDQNGTKISSYIKQFSNYETPFQSIDELIDDIVSNGTGSTESLDKIIQSIEEEVRKAKATASPLIIDLDGDGVETIADSLGNIHFDHDNNGFSELSGWVATDDGLLVRDINGNGKIDSGRELFGNNTLLANGQLAENGFTALVDLDSNYDGLINAADTAFTSLRVWKDTNSNGITDEGELLTMTQAGVQSISTSYTDKGTTGTEDAQGNQHRQTGSYRQTHLGQRWSAGQGRTNPHRA